MYVDDSKFLCVYFVYSIKYLGNKNPKKLHIWLLKSFGRQIGHFYVVPHLLWELWNESMVFYMTIAPIIMAQWKMHRLLVSEMHEMSLVLWELKASTQSQLHFQGNFFNNLEKQLTNLGAFRFSKVVLFFIKTTATKDVLKFCDPKTATPQKNFLASGSWSFTPTPPPCHVKTQLPSMSFPGVGWWKIWEVSKSNRKSI